MRRDRVDWIARWRGPERNLGLFRVVVASQNALAFAIPTIVSLWAGAGIGVVEFLYLQALFSASMALLSVPTGAFADRLGRRMSLVVGALLHVAGAFAYVLAESFWSFVLAEVLLGTGIAFMQGADEAFMYASYASLNRGKSRQELRAGFAAVWGRIGRTGFWASALMMVLGGLASELHPRLPMALAALTCLSGLPFVFLLTEVKEESQQQAGRRELVAAGRYLMHREGSELRLLILLPALVGAFNQVGFWFYQPLMISGGMNGAACGLMMAAFNLFAGWSAARQSEKGVGASGRAEFVTPVLVLALGFWLMALFGANWGIVFALLHQWVRGRFGQAIYPACLGSAIDRAGREHLRATLVSFRALAFQLFYVPALFVARWLFGEFGLCGTLWCVGVLMLLVGLTAIVLERENVAAIE